MHLLAVTILLMVQFVSVDEQYEEIRTHNAKLEARFSDWSNRVRLQADHLNISEHPAIIRWREQLVQLNFDNELDALVQLNRMVNSDISYRDDYHHFHKADFWADPETTLTEGGDCEDIALVKAAILLRFDWPGDKMHLLIGYLTERGKKEPHALLLVETTGGEQLVMRSITDEVVRPSEFDFIPIYAVDRNGTLIVRPNNPHH